MAKVSNGEQDAYDKLLEQLTFHIDEVLELVKTNLSQHDRVKVGAGGQG